MNARMKPDSLNLSLQIHGPRLGTVIEASADGVFVDYPENPEDRAPPANLGGLISLYDLKKAARDKAGVVLLFENSDPRRPVIVGLVRPPGEAFKKVRVQAEEILIEGEKSVTIRTGESGIRLNEAEALIKGDRVVSRAKNRNRIQGSGVDIN